MPSLADAATRDQIHRRLDRLRADAPPVWGGFTPPQMLAHVTDALRMATGELPVAARPAPALVRHAPVKQLLLYVLPFPKGLPTSPELLVRALGQPGPDWARERVTFAAALDRLAGRGAGAAWPRHPFFGQLSGRAWGVLQYRHCDHHLRQFGV